MADAPSTPVDEQVVGEILDDERSDGRWGWRIVAVVLGLGTLGLWGWIFWWEFSGNAYENIPGQLNDPAFAVAAEPQCALARGELALLPRAGDEPDATARAATVDRGTEIWDQLRLELTTQIPAGERDGRMVREWLADWEIYLDDRRDYADRLRQDPMARYYVTQSDRDRRQITEAIERFANFNKMASCAAPDDVG